LSGAVGRRLDPAATPAVGWRIVRRARSSTPLPPGFAIIWMCVALDLVGFGIVFPILPVYAKRFHASSATATGLVAAFALASFVFSPVWGRLSDRIGRKPILLLSLAGTAVGSLLTGLAGGIAILYLGRIIDGISGASVSVAQASVSDVATKEQRARLFGLLGAAFGVGFVAGPALGALAALAGPRVPFFVAAALSGVNTVAAARRLPETHGRGARTNSERGPLRVLPADRGRGMRDAGLQRLRSHLRLVRPKEARLRCRVVGGGLRGDWTRDSDGAGGHRSPRRVQAG